MDDIVFVQISETRETTLALSCSRHSVQTIHRSRFSPRSIWLIDTGRRVSAAASELFISPHRRRGRNWRVETAVLPGKQCCWNLKLASALARARACLAVGAAFPAGQAFTRKTTIRSVRSPMVESTREKQLRGWVFTRIRLCSNSHFEAAFPIIRTS